MSAIYWSGLLIDEQFMQEWSPLGKDIDYSEIRWAVLATQDTMIQPILGSDLYQRLMDGTAASYYVASGYTGGTGSVPIGGGRTAAVLNTNEEFLLSQIRMSLCFNTLTNAFDFISSKVRNKGVLQGNSPMAAVTPPALYEQQRAQLRSLAGFWVKRLQDYLYYHGAQNFPQYYSNQEPMWFNPITQWQSSVAYPYDDERRRFYALYAPDPNGQVFNPRN